MNNPDLNMLYLQKGEIITNLEILQERLQMVNKKIADHINKATAEQNKEVENKKGKEVKLPKEPDQKK